LLLVVVAGRRMVAVVRKLGIKPGVDGRHEVAVPCGVTDLGAVRQLAIDDRDAVRAQHEFVQAGHLFAINHGLIVEITCVEAFCLIRQVGADKRNLFAVC
jgi:hypothetical protein